VTAVVDVVRIGCGAGFAGDRFDAGVAVARTLAASAGAAYLIYETLGERTLALAQLDRRRDPEAGYTPGFEGYLRPVLRQCGEAGIRIVANFGAANPLSAGRRVRALARELDLPDLRVGVVEGDDLLERVGADEIRTWPNDEGVDLSGHEIVAANAYLGAGPLVAALAAGADVVIAGRCTDSALALAPLVHEFGWAVDDWQRLAGGVLAGHLIECAGQISGGYFADPGFKDVERLGELGFPIVEVDRGGAMVVTKARGTGGLVSSATVKEQLLYEIHDPAAYLTPDVTLDITEVEVHETGADRVAVGGAIGRPPPPTYKVTVSFESGYLGEGEISYAGPNALARAKLAAEVLRRRLEILAIDRHVRCDIIGTVATFDSDDGQLGAAQHFPADGDYRVRLAGEAPDRATADRLAREVLSLYCCGPAGGAGVRTSVTGRLRTVSCYVPPSTVAPTVIMLGTADG
jgi:hypothetical protein